jgi:hypothetical protein
MGDRSMDAVSLTETIDTAKESFQCVKTETDYYGVTIETETQRLFLNGEESEGTGQVTEIFQK